MVNSFEIVGDTSPSEVIQQDPHACLPACLVGIIDHHLGVDEADVISAMNEDGLYEPGVGTGLYPAYVLDRTIQKFGLVANAVFDARVASGHEASKIEERLEKISDALRQDGASLILAFPKQRKDQPAFLHYCSVTGYQETAEGAVVTVMDPSDYVDEAGNRDGGVKQVPWDEFLDYITPTENVPVMAWSVRDVAQSSPEAAVTDHSIVGIPGFGLLDEPLSREEDTGKAIPPDSEHPSSVAMPTTDITKQFSELGDVVLSREGELPVGYPRFVVPPQVRKLSAAVIGSLDGLPFPTYQAAEAATHLGNTYNYGNGTKITEAAGLFWLPGAKMNNDAWQHTGLGISSRQAQATLEGRGENDLDRRIAAEHTIKTAIREQTGASYQDIYLYPTGMAAIHHLNQALVSTSEGAPGVQFGFPYTDTFEQRRFGPSPSMSQNIVDIRDGDYGKLGALIHEGQPIRHVMTECPGNPKLWTPDFHYIDDLLEGEAPVVIDDTIGTFFNVDDKKLPNSVVARATSLTKFFSSTGDVMGGSVILRPESIYYRSLKGVLDASYEDTLWYEDAEALARNSAHFPGIMPAINSNAATLTEWLDEEWTGDDRPIKAVYHPSRVNRHAYDAIKKDGAGYGGVMSLKFNYPEKGYRFFDELDITKGPSLGTYFTLGCLYTWLAHKPVGSVERFGVSPDLVRISVGIESLDELKARFEQALRSLV